MQDLFIKADDEFITELTVAVDKNGVIFCDISKESLEQSIDGTEDMDIQSYKVVFKKPSFGDNLELYGEIFTAFEDASVNFNPLRIRHNKMVALIKSWNLKGVDEKPTEKDIKALSPIISTAIGIQMDAVLGNEF